MSDSSKALYRAMITPAFGVRPASAWLLAAKILFCVVAVLVVLVTGAVVYFWTPDLPVEKLKTRWATPPSSFIPMDGMQVHFRDEGPRDDPMPIVLLHGTFSSLHTWQGWTERLKSRHRVISMDRPGFGLTGPNPKGCYTMAYYTDFLRRFLDHMKVQRAIIVGHSSGGKVAWHFALAFPDRVARLVLIAPRGYPQTRPLPVGFRLSMSPVFGPLVEHILPHSVIEKAVRGTFGDPSKVTSETVDRTYELMLREGNRQAVGATLRQALDATDYNLIREVRVPTLILWGSRDTYVPPADARRFHADIPHSKLVMVPGVGHLAQEEDAIGTLAAFERFLAECHASTVQGQARRRVQLRTKDRELIPGTSAERGQWERVRRIFSESLPAPS